MRTVEEDSALQAFMKDDPTPATDNPAPGLRRHARLPARSSGLRAVLLLAASFVVVSLLYAVWITPAAEATDLRNRMEAAQQADEAFVPERNIPTILRNFEQQVCLSLFVWALALMAGKFAELRRERFDLRWPFEDMEAGERILPGTALETAKRCEAAAEEAGAGAALAARAVSRALHRFHSTASVQETSQAVQELADSESNRLDSEMAIIRYTAWAIPSIGFIGTVRGIGEALMRADQAIQGDVSGVTSALGLAFNSTFVALLLSIFLMLGVYTLQRQQEAHVQSVENFCRDKLIENMKAPAA
ncbi:MAG: MotA/TolQ/ExbB proton channel family protein [Opitutales bacterium]|nr:MotA/TolQ/ExbB proton channel family protein [Opitutales bacterium]